MFCNPLSHRTILTIIHNHFEKKWALKIMTDNRKVNHLDTTAQCLTLHNAEGKGQFDRIVTSDEK